MTNKNEINSKEISSIVLQRFHLDFSLEEEKTRSHRMFSSRHTKDIDKHIRNRHKS